MHWFFTLQRATKDPPTTIILALRTFIAFSKAPLPDRNLWGNIVLSVQTAQSKYHPTRKSDSFGKFASIFVCFVTLLIIYIVPFNPVARSFHTYSYSENTKEFIVVRNHMCARFALMPSLSSPTWLAMNASTLARSLMHANTVPSASQTSQTSSNISKSMRKM